MKVCRKQLVLIGGVGFFGDFLTQFSSQPGATYNKLRTQLLSNIRLFWFFFSNVVEMGKLQFAFFPKQVWLLSWHRSAHCNLGSVFSDSCSGRMLSLKSNSIYIKILLLSHTLLLAWSR